MNRRWAYRIWMLLAALFPAWFLGTALLMDPEDVEWAVAPLATPLGMVLLAVTYSAVAYIAFTILRGIFRVVVSIFR